MTDVTGADLLQKQKLILAAYGQILASMFMSTLFCVVLLAGPLAWIGIKNYNISGPRLDYPVQVVILLAGALGAFFSALMRLYSLDRLPAALMRSDMNGLGRFHLTIYSLVPPVTGMIGAIVLYYAFASGLVGGDLFPKFTCDAIKSRSHCGVFFPDIFYLVPETAQAYAKCVVWAFIAGFSERLVPDALGRLEHSQHPQ